MSNVYGLGVENVLEMEVVTPNGDIVTANTESYPDLFWALRGGGGSTYGITTKITYKVYPMPPFAFYWVAFAPVDPDFDSYYQALSYYYSQSPQFTDFGISGYPVASKWGYVGPLIAPNKTNEEVDAFFAPMAERMRKQWNITLEAIALPPPSLGEILWPRQAPTTWAEPATQFYTMSSRLIARSAMTESNLPAIFKFVKTTLEDDSWHLPYPNMPGIAKRNREWNVSLNPAWLDASMHFIILNNNFDSLKEIRSYYDRLDKYLSVFDTLSVNSAAYVNEVRYDPGSAVFDSVLTCLLLCQASPFEKDWKKTFFGSGERYEKLLSIKKKYDPNNTLWCFPCVGGDIYKEDKDGRLYK
jgi:FAD/FMN-containing dehydrogenase